MRPDLFVCCLETRFLGDWARCEAFWGKVQQALCGLLPGLLPQPPRSAEWQGRRRTHQCKGSMSCFLFFFLSPARKYLGKLICVAKPIPFYHEHQWDLGRGWLLAWSLCRICLPWYFGVPKMCLGTGSVLTCLSLPETQTAGKCGAGAQGLGSVCLPNSAPLWKSCW